MEVSLGGWLTCILLEKLGNSAIIERRVWFGFTEGLRSQ